MREAGRHAPGPVGVRGGGFTLIEVLAALCILALALLVYLNVVVAAQYTTRKSDNLTVASRVASDRIVQIQATAFSSLTDSTTIYALSSPPGASMTVTIAPLDGNAANTMIKQADVIVKWPGTAAAPQAGGQVRMTTLVSTGR